MGKSITTSMTVPITVLGALLSVIVSSNAYALKLDYSHEYVDTSHAQKDSFALSHTFKSGLGLKVKYKFEPQDKANGDAGNAFSNNKLNEREYEVKYGWKLPHGWKLVPEMKYRIKDKEKKYQPQLMVDYKIAKHTSVGLGYQYYVKIKSGKSQQNYHDIKAKVSQSIGRVDIDYEYTHYDSNKRIFNNGHDDYKHDVTVAYNINKSLAPYVEFENVSDDSKSSHRETEFYVGIGYKF